MAANRYTEFNPQPYVSTYVPLPLDTMYKALATKQASYDKSEEEEGALMDLQAKIKALDQVQAFGNTYDVEDKKYVQDYFSKLNQEINTKADELVSGDKSSSQYKNWLRKKSRELNSEMTTGKLGQINQAYNVYQAQQKAIADAKDLGISAWRANQIDANRMQYGQGRGYLSGNQLAELNIGEYVDRNKEFDELSKGINSEITQMYKSADGRGYIQGRKMEEIVPEKIQQMVRSFLPNSKTNLDIKEELNRKVLTGQLDPKDYQAAYAQEYQKIEDAMVAKYRMSKGDVDLTADSTWQYNDKKKTDLEMAYPLQQTKEGRTSKFMVDKLAGLNVVDANGNFDITKLHESNIDAVLNFVHKYTVPTMVSSITNASDKLTYKQKQDAVAIAFNDMANFLGIKGYKVKRSATDDPTKVADYNDILRAYSRFQESRGTALAYDQRVSPSYSKQLNTEPTNYTYYDEDGTELSGDTRESLMTDDKKVVTGRDYIPTANGSKFVQEFKTADGKTYYAQYKGQIETNHYNGLAKIIDSQDNYIKNYRSGKNKPVSSTYDRQDEVDKIVSDLQQASPTLKGYNIATVDKSPDGEHIIVTKVDPTNPLNMKIDRYKKSGDDYELDAYDVSTKDVITQYDADYGRSQYSPIKGYQYNNSGTSVTYGTSTEK